MLKHKSFGKCETEGLSHPYHCPIGVEKSATVVTEEGLVWCQRSMKYDTSTFSIQKIEPHIATSHCLLLTGPLRCFLQRRLLLCYIPSLLIQSGK